MSRKNVYKLNSKHLISDDSEEDESEVDWSINSEVNNYEDDKENLSEEDLSEDYYNLEEIILEQTHNVTDPEINIEVVEDENKEKAIKITIELELENESNDIINIDFTINKKTFLKFAKKLK